MGGGKCLFRRSGRHARTDGRRDVGRNHPSHVSENLLGVMTSRAPQRAEVPFQAARTGTLSPSLDLKDVFSLKVSTSKSCRALSLSLAPCLHIYQVLEGRDLGGEKGSSSTTSLAVSAPRSFVGAGDAGEIRTPAGKAQMTQWLMFGTRHQKYNGCA